MQKTLRTFFFLFVALSSSALFAQNEVRIGYCADEIGSSATAVGYSAAASTTIGAGIRIPGSRLKSYTGAQLTKVRFVAQAGLTGLKVWVKPDFDQTSVASSNRVAATTEGWNEVALKTPYTITGEDIVVTYTCTLPAGQGLYFDGVTDTSGAADEHSAFLQANNTWQDAHTWGYGALYLQAVIETEAGQASEDVALESCILSSKYQKIGEEATATFKIANYGTDTLAVPQLFYQIGEEEAVAVPVSGNIAPQKTTTFTATLPTDGCVSGANPLKAWIVSENSYKGNDSISTQLLCYDTAFPRKTLIEHFTTLGCVNCPYGHNVLRLLLSGRNDYVWVSHHVGYGTDELTVSKSNSIYNVSGASGAPYAMFDRTILSITGDASSSSYPAFGIGYNNASYGAKLLTTYLDQCVSTPAFVSVDLENDYDEETRQLSVRVFGERGALLDYFYPTALLSVELVEDSVETQAKQTGSGETLHSNVFRATLSQILGDTIQWNGDEYSATYGYTLPEGWNARNVRVVAFINQPKGTGYTGQEILNAQQLPVLSTSTEGIGQVKAGGSEEILSRTYFNLAGQRILAPTRGIFLEQITTPSGTQTRKRVMP